MSVSLTHANAQIKVEGELTFETTPKAIDDGLAILRSAANVKLLDMTRVQRMDSAGLAFIIAMQREAEKTARKLVVENIPHNMLDVVDVYGLQNILPSSAFQLS